MVKSKPLSGEGHLPDLQSTIQNTRIGNGLVRARKSGSTFSTACVPMELLAAIETQGRLEAADIRAGSIAWEDAPSGLGTTLQAWDRQIRVAGLHILELDVVVSTQTCWSPPALMLPTTAVADLCQAIAGHLEHRADLRAWGTMPWRLRFDDVDVGIWPWHEPRTGFEHRLTTGLSAILSRWLEPRRPWFETLGAATIVQFAAPPAT